MAAKGSCCGKEYIKELYNVGIEAVTPYMGFTSPATRKAFSEWNDEMSFHEQSNTFDKVMFGMFFDLHEYVPRYKMNEYDNLIGIMIDNIKSVRFVRKNKKVTMIKMGNSIAISNECRFTFFDMYNELAFKYADTIDERLELMCRDICKQIEVLDLFLKGVCKKRCLRRSIQTEKSAMSDEETSDKCSRILEDIAEAVVELWMIFGIIGMIMMYGCLLMS